MKNKFDNILLGTLWIIVSVLGICFWFNSQYGFNIFANTHWKHLAYMQATQQPIKLSFYLSMIIAVFIAIIGLYTLIRPRIRKIAIPIRDTKATPKTHQPAPAPQPAPVTPAPVQPSNQIPETDLQRPARLNIGHTPTSNFAPTAPVAPVAPVTAPPVAPTYMPPTSPQPQNTRPDETDPEMAEIFKSAGYHLLPAPMISGLQFSVLALAQDETVWIGTTDAETSTVAATIAVMTQVFSETLEEIPITVHGFIVGASDAAAPQDTSIMTFDSMNALREYISAHPNPPTDPEDAENFEAFSTFISTVIDYLRTL